MGWFRSKDLLDRTFEIGIILKGLDGLLELIGGTLLLAVSPATINRVVGALTQHELSEDPREFVATHLLRLSHGLTGPAVGFAAAYLLLHGIGTGSWASPCSQQSVGLPVDDRLPGHLHRLPALQHRPAPHPGPDRVD